MHQLTAFALALTLVACGGKDDSASPIVDDDGDGYAVEQDCDDGDPDVNPDADEEPYNGLDDDCDPTTLDDDLDQDGYDLDEDCDDTDAAINPDAEETCDEVDNDCDGEIDDGAVDASTWYFDGDADGHGGEEEIQACGQPDHYVDSSGDCNDGHSGIHPDAEETCDYQDNDCDGEVDEDDAKDAGSWYADEDEDGYGSGAATQACQQPAGHVATAGDCDDDDGNVNPDADETCDKVDNDCDGTVDEDDAIDAATWYLDDDEDGYGDSDVQTTACSQPTQHVSDAGDCDDTAFAVNPGAEETCDKVDNDCDGAVDEGDAVDAATWYQDGDGDGYGDPTVTSTACSQPTGYVADATDCDDDSANFRPGAPEYCDDIDHDCDGDVAEDDSLDASTWYADLDGDGYGGDRISTIACDQPSGFEDDSEDCDDTDASVNPGATEVYNGVDDDCSGAIDDGVPEVCDNGVDDDIDGLVDCEDSDCVLECIEDCSDGIDNDGDGSVDCDDDECIGATGCRQLYALSSNTDLDQISWAFGPLIERNFGWYAALYFIGTVELTGTGWGGAPTFTCSGDVRAWSWDDSHAGYAQGLVPQSTGGAMDYYFSLELSESDGSISWDDSCPVSDLPQAYLGLNSYVHAMYRFSASGSWYAQYTPSRYVSYNLGPSYMYATYLYDAAGANAVNWTGYY